MLLNMLPNLWSTLEELAVKLKDLQKSKERKDR